MARRFQIMAYFQLVLMITINVGISFYAHTCQSSGHRSFLLTPEDDPCTVQEVVQMNHHEQNACCSLPIPEKESEFSKKCCSTEHHILQIDNDFSQQAVHSLIQLAETCVLPIAFNYERHLLDFPVEDVHSSSNLAHAPPILQGRKLHIVNEVFRN